ncbi:MAG: hypothetical protein J6M64_07200 [Oscillospiraceae bacterium]|nr:hypothetical protein [Oscillospiraceae bacterium]
MSTKKNSCNILQILSFFLILLTFPSLFSSSASAGPIRDGICLAGEAATSSLSPFENPSTASDSVLSEESSLLSSTSETLLLSKYNQAKELLYTRHFSEAKEIFISLADFADSRELASFCRSYPSSEIPFDYPLITKPHKSYSDGAVYWHPRGLFYVPSGVTSHTSFLLYYCGGNGAINWLSYSDVFQYFKVYHPDTIIFFCNGPGGALMDEQNIFMYHVLQQIAKECGVIVHNLSAVGSSSGCYSALNAAASLYDAFGIRLTNVCSMDAAADWDSWALLSDAEMDSVAAAGTTFYLFEQHSTKPETPAIQNMISHNIDTWLISCSSANHSAISKNAFEYGIFSWSGGENISFPTSEYVFTHLTPDIEKPFTSPVSPFSPLPFGKDTALLSAG